MGSKRRITVAIPVRNGAETIVQAVRSVIDQSFPDWRVLIHDNSSTDGTCDLVEAIGDDRIELVRHTGHPVGMARSWNRCLSDVGEGFFQLLCADDLLHPECFAAKMEIAEHSGNSGTALFTSNRMLIGRDGRELFCMGFSRERTQADIYRAMEGTWLKTNPIGDPSTGLIRSEALRDGVFRFSGRYPFYVDMELWLHALGRGPLFHLPRALSYFRLSRSSVSSARFLKNLADSLRFYRERLKPFSPNGALYLAGFCSLLAMSVARQMVYLAKG